MPKATHTPGPWEHDDQFIVAPDPRGLHCHIYIAEIVERDDEGRIAKPRQQLANARLIAAAPELLAVAELAMAYLDGQEYLQASAIIAKAKEGGR
jgi:hypothetical protein